MIFKKLPGNFGKNHFLLYSGKGNDASLYPMTPFKKIDMMSLLKFLYKGTWDTPEPVLRGTSLFSDVAVDEESRECADYRYDNDEDSEAVGEVLDDCACAYRKPDD